jgi:hypothetical protein
MPEDSELRLVNIFGTVPSTATQFEVIPTPTVQRIGTVSSGSDQLTVNDITGVTAGLYIYGEGIPMGTQVDSILGNIVTMTENATAFLQGQVTFYEEESQGLLPLSAGQKIRFY